MKMTLITVIIIIIIGIVWFVASDRSSNNTVSLIPTNTETDTSDEDTSPSTDSQITTKNVDEEIPYIVHDWHGDLVDVSGGDASGNVEAVFVDGAYDLVATLENLPTPSGTDFYEGWIIRNDPSEVLSTGKIDLIDGNYTNTFMSSIDLLDHDFYVLTLEPDDGDPAPAKHILEGTLVQ